MLANAKEDLIMSRYYTKMSTNTLRDELDRLEDRLQDLEEDEAAAIGIRNQIFYICEALCHRESAAG